MQDAKKVSKLPVYTEPSGISIRVQLNKVESGSEEINPFLLQNLDIFLWGQNQFINLSIKLDSSLICEPCLYFINTVLSIEDALQ